MSRKPRLLDLFCGAGGCSMGYSRAGFDVVGVDIAAQPNYPFEFVRADALAFLRNLAESEAILGGIGYAAEDGEGASGTLGLALSDFEVVHASPPCQCYSRCKRIGNAREGHQDMLDATRELLVQTGKPWVIENVPGAPLDGVLLCGTMFGLAVRRHRLFECSGMLLAPGQGCRHTRDDLGVYAGKVTRLGSRAAAYLDSQGRTHYRPQLASLADGQAAMGIQWMDRHELVQAIPPAYTEWIGRQLREVYVATNQED